jgi:hypothetical protein
LHSGCGKFFIYYSLDLSINSAGPTVHSDASGNLLEDTVTMTVNGHDDWFPGFWRPGNNPQTEKHSLLWTYDARGRMASVTAEEELDDNHGHIRI